MNAPPIGEFRPRAPWLGGDLQTLRNYLLRPRFDFGRWPGRRVSFTMPDGSGDRLLGTYHEPGPSAAERSLTVLVHGLSGCEDSTYIQQTAIALLAAGHAVLRLNLRGAGPSRAVCGGHYSAGSSEDLGEVLQQLRSRPIGAYRGIAAVGYSLGGNVLLKYLGETGTASAVDRAVAVSPPIDLTRTSTNFRRLRNRPYQTWLLSAMKSEAIAPGARVSDAEYAAILSARDIWEFDDGFTSRRCGFDGAADYYHNYSSRHFIPAIERPTAVIHASDDPWIPYSIFTEFSWETAESVSLVMTNGGGHVGFHGRGGRLPWHDRFIAAFLDGGSVEDARQASAISRAAAGAK